ncbi:helix-turn-helix transcriptional regulator [Alterisphingorhabdus coralli]|uniref:LuxR C-terminal-related transcriptional regulator n=1 Tax=Alterisphingorhabdus coralli TaxID=3071408 RepID=A0AA97I1X9_9SPHN|nr:LuxR C-terminal-related transcriptional regulator [Parasphingorhabdus sp. SCSIO 66989]WOE75200.1 LuxR C-terminal-related transcriptional regulator [Parasphingorhabdus sp. SCSIO 66989]
MKVEERKYRPPKVLRNQVLRQALVNRIVSGTDYPLTILLAPGGFGKSTLLGQIGARFEYQGATLAWLTCENSDSEAENFVQSLRLALARSDTAFAECRPTISAIIATLENKSEPSVLVIDDFERIAGEEAYSVIELLVTLLPDGHRVLLASRHFDEARLARFLLDETATAIDAAALALSDTETRELLGDTCDNATITRVLEVSEGWPMMLQLARIKASQPGGNAHLVENLLRPHSELFGFLAEEVVGTLPKEQADLLIDCSIIDYIDAGIAEALTGTDRAEATLMALTLLDPLISSQTEPVLTLKLHPVMQGYLQQALMRKGSSAVAELHLRASRYFTDRGDIFRAIEHAMEAHNPEFAAEIFEEIGGPLAILSHGPAKVWSFLSQMPRPLIDGRVALSGTQILRAITLGDGLGAQHLYPRFQQLLDQQPQDLLLNSKELALLVELGRAMLIDACEPIHAFLEERMPAIEVLVRRRSEDEPRILGLFLAFKFFLEARHGSIIEAQKTVTEYEEVCDRLAFSSQLPSISPHLGMIAFQSGEFDRAAWYFSENLAHHWDGFVGREELLIRVGNSFLAKMFYEQDRLNDAQANIRAVPEVREATFMELIEARDVTKTRCIAQQDSIPRAIEHLDRTIKQRSLYGLNNMLPTLDALRVELLVRGREVDAAAAHYETCDLVGAWKAERQHAHWNWIFVEAFLRSSSNLHLSREEPQELLVLGQEICRRAEQMGRVLTAELARIAMAGAYTQMGDEEAARLCLERSLAVHHNAGIVRPYFDLSLNLAPVLEGMRTAHIDDANDAHLTTILSLWDESMHSAKLAKLLTPRESDVLAELAKGQPTKLIARNLGVSPETVKHHLKNIFAKLEVENRKDAVSEAYRRAL